MLRIIYVLVVFGIHKNSYGNSTPTDEGRHDFYPPRRNYSSRSQNETSPPSKSSQNLQSQVIFGSRLKPKIRMYRNLFIEGNKTQHFDSQKTLRSDSQNLQNINISRNNSVSNYSGDFSPNQKLWSEISSETNYRQNSLIKKGNSPKSQNSLDSNNDSENSSETNDYQNAENYTSFGKRFTRDYLKVNNYNNSQSHDAFELGKGQNSFEIRSNKKPRSLISFRSSNSQNGQYIGHGQNRIKTSYGQTTQPDNNLENLKLSTSNCNVTSNTIFFRKFGSKSVHIMGQNNFKAPDYLPPTDKSIKTIYKADEYLPPTQTGSPLSPKTTNKLCHSCISKKPFNTMTPTTRRYYTINKITTRPLDSTTIPKTMYKTITTKKPYYISIEKQTAVKRPNCHTCGSTRGPFYIPVTKPTSTNSNKMKMTEYDPAMAMKVPLEDDETIILVSPETNRFGDSSEDTSRGDVELKNTPKTTSTTIIPRPVDRINERGDVPDDKNLITTTTKSVPTEAMAIPMSEEPKDELTTTTCKPTTIAPITSPSNTTTTMLSKPTITTDSTTVPTTPSTTTPRIPMVTTTENNLHQAEQESRSSTPITKMKTTSPMPFKGPEYLPPEDTTTNIVPAITTTTNSPEVAPAMAMNVPPEPDDEPNVTPSSPPMTTVATTLTNTMIMTPKITFTTESVTTNRMIQTMTTPETNRHLIEEVTSPTTSINTMQTTCQCQCPMPFTGPEYLLPEDTTESANISTISFGPAAAMAMPVPSEPDDVPSPPPLLTSTTSILPNDTFSNEESSDTSLASRDTNPFKAPEYLPPKESAPVTPAFPLPAMAMPVTSEPECDPDSSAYPYIAQRSFTDDPCIPKAPEPSTKPPFKGPLYLPPLPKTRAARSSNNTLGLRDLKGTPRPVWFAGIYRKITDPYYPICGGSIVREDVVISAAHCFWDDSLGQLPANMFAVAARKIHKRYNDPMDKNAQKSEVLEIKIPPRFLGSKTSFQEDIAILKLATPFTFTRSVRGLRPICVDFDNEFDQQQMTGGHMGTVSERYLNPDLQEARRGTKVAGWGYTDASGTATKVLLWLELPYVEIEKCIRDSEDSFLKYITCDKVCAGENDTGKSLCKGDSGGGLAFWAGTPAHATPYLRGVASTAPTRLGAECNVFAYASFTHVRAHRTFLRTHVPGIEECRFWE